MRSTSVVFDAIGEGRDGGEGGGEGEGEDGGQGVAGEGSDDCLVAGAKVGAG